MCYIFCLCEACILANVVNDSVCWCTLLATSYKSQVHIGQHKPDQHYAGSKVTVAGVSQVCELPHSEECTLLADDSAGWCTLLADVLLMLSCFCSLHRFFRSFSRGSQQSAGRDVDSGPTSPQLVRMTTMHNGQWICRIRFTSNFACNLCNVHVYLSCYDLIVHLRMDFHNSGWWVWVVCALVIAVWEIISAKTQSRVFQSFIFWCYCVVY